MTNQDQVRDCFSELIDLAKDANTGGTKNQKMVKHLEEKFAQYQQDHFNLVFTVDCHDVLVSLNLFGKTLRLFRCINLEGTNKWAITYSHICRYDHLFSNIHVTSRFFTKTFFDESEVFDMLCEEFVKPKFKDLVIRYYKHLLEEK